MKIPPVIPTCEALIEQLGSITHMQRGTLTEQYLQRPSPDGHGTVTLGPYFKFPVWEDGRNHTRSVPADEATALREDIANHHIFQQASQQLADLREALGTLQPPASLKSIPILYVETDGTGVPSRAEELAGHPGKLRALALRTSSK